MAYPSDKDFIEKMLRFLETPDGHMHDDGIFTRAGDAASSSQVTAQIDSWNGTPVGHANFNSFNVLQRPGDIIAGEGKHHDPKAFDHKPPRNYNRSPCARCKYSRKRCAPLNGYICKGCQDRKLDRCETEDEFKEAHAKAVANKQRKKALKK